MPEYADQSAFVVTTIFLLADIVIPIALLHVLASMYGIGLTCPVVLLLHQASDIQYSDADGIFVGTDFVELFGKAPISTTM